MIVYSVLAGVTFFHVATESFNVLEGNRLEGWKLPSFRG